MAAAVLRARRALKFFRMLSDYGAGPSCPEQAMWVSLKTRFRRSQASDVTNRLINAAITPFIAVLSGISDQELTSGVMRRSRSRSGVRMGHPRSWATTQPWPAQTSKVWVQASRAQQRPRSRDRGRVTGSRDARAARHGPPCSRCGSPRCSTGSPTGSAAPSSVCASIGSRAVSTHVEDVLAEDARRNRAVAGRRAARWVPARRPAELGGRDVVASGRVLAPRRRRRPRVRGPPRRRCRPGHPGGPACC